MENFHIDILENILFRLPFTAALQAKQVCKTRKAILVSYHLAGNNQVQLYYGEQYDRTRGDVDHRKKMMNYFYGRFNGKFTGGDLLVVGSCNGLRWTIGTPDICYLQVVKQACTGNRWVRLLPHSTNKYKIVRIYYRKYTEQAKRKRYPIEEPYESWYARMMSAGFE